MNYCIDVEGLCYKSFPWVTSVSGRQSLLIAENSITAYNTVSDIYQVYHKISNLAKCTKYSKYIIPKLYKFPVMIFSVFYKMMSSQISCYTFYPMLLSSLYWMRETGLITTQDLLGCLGSEFHIIKSSWYLLNQQPYLAFILKQLNRSPHVLF